LLGFSCVGFCKNLSENILCTRPEWWPCQTWVKIENSTRTWSSYGPMLNKLHQNMSLMISKRSAPTYINTHGWNAMCTRKNT
jgi:hypothetical protein